MTAIRFLCFATLLSVFPFRVSGEDFTNAIHAYLKECVEAQKINGCIVVAIIDEHGGSVISYGKLDNGTGQEADGDTLFGIHSATGEFTRLLLQDMVGRREVNLDDPADSYLPNSVKMPAGNGKKITLRNLAQEASGLPDFVDKLDFKRADNMLGDFTVEKMDAFVSGCQLTNDPGTTHFHGGVDMGLLGQAMALKAGTDYESLMKERILQPLNMDSTWFTLKPGLKYRLAGEHDEWGLGYVIPVWDWGALAPVAGLYSTANDLLKFAAAELGLTPSPMTSLMKKSDAEFPYVSQGDGIVHIGGGGLGGGSYIGFDKARRRGVIVLSTAYVVRHDLGYYLFESEWQSARRPVETNINPRVYGSYVGQYLPASNESPRWSFWPFSHSKAGSAPQTGIGVRCEGERLFAQMTGPDSSPADEFLPPVAAELLPQTESNLFERLSGRPITFSRNYWGRVTGLVVNYQGRTFLYKKVSDRPPASPQPVDPPAIIKLNPKLLEVCTGYYEFMPNAIFPTGMKLIISREGNRLVGKAWGEKVVKGAFDIYPRSETIFFDRYMYTQFTFVKDSHGDVTAVIRHQLGQSDYEGKKQKLR